MIAPAPASVCEPFDRMAVTTAGSAVGIAATANATALRNSSWAWMPRYRPSAIETTSATPAMTRIWFVSASSCFVSGVFSTAVAWSMPLMWPTSVAIPVVTTRMVPGPPGDLAVHERHVDAVAEGGVGGDRVHLLGRRDALAGERGLVDLEGRRGEDPRVRGDEVAGLDVDDVARDELVHRELDEIAVPADLDLDDHHPLEGRRARLRLALLVHRHPRVEQGQQDQEDAGVELAGQEQADDARDEEHDLHRVRVLAAERLPARHLLRLGERVRAVRRTPGVGLGRRQPDRRVDAPGRPAASSGARACHRTPVATSVGAVGAVMIRPPCQFAFPRTRVPASALDQPSSSPSRGALLS